MLQAAGALGIAVMLVSTLLGVADRLVLAIGLTWTDELARLALVWTSMIAAAIVVRDRSHFALTIIFDRLGAAGRVGIDALLLAGLALLAWQGVRFTVAVAQQTSPVLGLPMSCAYAAVPAFALLSIGFILRDNVRRLHGRRLC